jgi:hypothetical protein
MRMAQNKILKQITLFAENKPGRLTSATKILSEKGINIRAFTIADTGEFGIIRFVVDDADAAFLHLQRGGFTVSETDVLGLEMPDKPGALFEISSALSDNEINVDYAYAYASATPGKAILILQASDLTKAAELLTERGFPIVETSP